MNHNPNEPLDVDAIRARATPESKADVDALAGELTRLRDLLRRDYRPNWPYSEAYERIADSRPAYVFPNHFSWYSLGDAGLLLRLIHGAKPARAQSVDDDGEWFLQDVAIASLSWPLVRALGETLKAYAERLDTMPVTEPPHPIGPAVRIELQEWLDDAGAWQSTPICRPKEPLVSAADQGEGHPC